MHALPPVAKRKGGAKVHGAEVQGCRGAGIVGGRVQGSLTQAFMPGTEDRPGTFGL